MNRQQANSLGSGVAFTNASIVPPVAGKPHICMRAGYWRVSPYVAGSKGLFYSAHSYTNQENYKISARKDAGVANGETPTPRTAAHQLTVNYLLPRKRIKL